jgi:death-on-curing protein
MAPDFLSLEDILRLHGRSLTEYGGSAGIRDRGAVESALHAPQADFFYRQADLFGIAAAYAFHIAEAQAFIDGNKRTAIAAALTFLELNEINAKADSDSLYDAMIAIAEKRLDKAGLAARFRELFG